MTARPIHSRLAAVMLVDTRGYVLLQLRDEHARVAPNQWSMPGGHMEPGEDAETAARREMLEETGLHIEGALMLFWHGTRPSALRPNAVNEWFVYCSATAARQEDVVLGEGAAMVFIAPDEARALDLGDSAAYFVPLFLDSLQYRELAALAPES